MRLMIMLVDVPKPFSMRCGGMVFDEHHVGVGGRGGRIPDDDGLAVPFAAVVNSTAGAGLIVVGFARGGCQLTIHL